MILQPAPETQKGQQAISPCPLRSSAALGWAITHRIISKDQPPMQRGNLGGENIVPILTPCLKIPLPIAELFFYRVKFCSSCYEH